MRAAVAFLACVCLWMPGLASAGTTQIDRAGYAEQLRGFWLGQAIANWTGRQAEADRQAPPFYTDADWVGQGFQFVLQNPWRADDDTDIEYTYLHLLDEHQTHLLTPQQIADGWKTHINDKIWVSNAKARQLMGDGVLPPATGLPTANPYHLRIDAQLTTEMFGALAPAAPGLGLEMGLLPMLTTSAGHATHASQYFAVLHSLVPLVPEGLTPAEQVQWLNANARQYLPGTSKAADIVDFVTAEFLANPDKDDWESTRDKIAQRYQTDAAANGFLYRGWTESSVNFASGVLALLYGQGDYKRTVQIGTLSGWDADNPTATMGGLLGLLLGPDAIEDAFAGQTLSDRYVWSATRDALTDHLPADAAAEDTFTLMAERMLDITDKAVVAHGGAVDLVNNQWSVQEPDLDQGLSDSPTERIYRHSLNNMARLDGVTVTAGTSVAAASSTAGRFADGYEHDFSGREFSFSGAAPIFSTTAGATPGSEQAIWVVYGDSFEIEAVRFIEGGIDTDGKGGWFETLALHVLVDGEWELVTDALMSEALDANRPFQIIDFVLASPMTVEGIKLVGTAGGSDGWVTVSELDAVLVPEPEVAVITALGFAPALLVRRRRIGRRAAALPVR